MSESWRSHRRRRYAARDRAIATRPKPLAKTNASTWYRTPDGVEHAFPVGSGWMRSRCAKARWTAAVELLEDDQAPTNPCADCELLVNGTEAEKREAFGR
jgi:hypothetical protein